MFVLNGDLIFVIVVCEKFDKVVVVIVMMLNVDFEKEDKVGENVLMFVLLNGDFGFVKLLIDKGVEVSKKGWVLLYYVVING